MKTTAPRAQTPAPAQSAPPAQAPPQTPAPVAPPAQTQDIYVVGRDPIAAPRLIKNVKPTYTAEAMRGRIQGRVRLRAVVERDGSVSGVEVIESLDSQYGIDQSAIDSLKQWQFEPGTLNGAPVRVAITVDLAFTLRDSTPRETWPDGFAAGTTISSGIEETAEAQMVRVKIQRPATWVRTPPGPQAPWLRVNSGDGRDLAVMGPSEGQIELRWPVADQVVAQLAESVLRSQPVTDAQLVARGQAQLNGIVWVWASIRLPSVPAIIAGPKADLFREGRLWSFTTTINRKVVGLMCSVLIPRDVEGPAADARIQRAASEFSGILNSLRLEDLTK